jgi:hypothetical protein
MAELLTGFLKGNIEKYAPLLQSQMPRAASLLFRTIDPLICASLIDLLGSSQRFRKKMGMITPRQDPKGGQFFEVRLVYSVPDFIGYNGGEAPIKQDQEYILKKLKQVPEVGWPDTAVRIMPADGSVTVMFSMPVASAQRNLA